MIDDWLESDSCLEIILPASSSSILIIYKSVFLPVKEYQFIMS